MRLATWNVNSIRMRRDRVRDLLLHHRPEILCLQELKCTAEDFPREDFESLGYHCLVHGQKTYNGVALLSRAVPSEEGIGFDGDPIPGEARVTHALFGEVRVVNVYVVNGQSVGSEKYHLKLAWLDALTGWLKRTFSTEQPLLLAGDFNITPDDRDVHDPELWRGQILCTEEERQRVAALQRWGLADLFRRHTSEGGVFTWWDYREGSFARNRGLRLDLILGSSVMADRCISVEVDREARKATSGSGKPSDHAPVIATFRD